MQPAHNAERVVAMIELLVHCVSRINFVRQERMTPNQ